MTDACFIIAMAHYLIGRKPIYHLSNTPNSSLTAYISYTSRDTRSFATNTQNIIPKWINTVTITVTGMQSINNSRSLTVGCRICNANSNTRNVHCNSTLNVTATAAAAPATSQQDSKQRRWRQRQRATAAQQHEALYCGVLQTLLIFEHSHTDTIYH